MEKGDWADNRSDDREGLSVGRDVENQQSQSIWQGDCRKKGSRWNNKCLGNHPAPPWGLGERRNRLQLTGDLHPAQGPQPDAWSSAVEKVKGKAKGGIPQGAANTAGRPRGLREGKNHPTVRQVFGWRSNREEPVKSPLRNTRRTQRQKQRGQWWFPLPETERKNFKESVWFSFPFLFSYKMGD